MKNFALKEIYIENFKAIDRLHLRWEEEQLIVFDGPNGYGKTTIFDAIELVLTGKIDRIKKPEDARLAFSDVLFSNDPTKDLIIKVRFSFEEETINIAKVLPSSKRLTGQQKQPGRWEIFDTHLLESFVSDLTSTNKITQPKLNEMFEVTELERVFSIFYYIQQQENTAFLKRPGKERLSEISRLFDTKEEEEEMNYLETLKKYLVKEKKATEKSILGITSRIEGYNSIEGVQISEESKYISLLGDLPTKPWDSKDINIANRQIRDKIIEELMTLEDFINNFNEYKKAHFNKRLSKYADDITILECVVGGAKFLEDYQTIKILRDKEKRVQGFHSQLKEFSKNMYSIDYGALQLEVEMDFQLDLILEKVENIKTQGTTISQFSKIVTELNQTRTKLIEQMNSFHKHQDTTAEDCPLCGYTWGDHEKMLFEFKQKKEYFSSLHDESSVKQNQEIEDLFEDHLKEAFKWLEQYLSNSEFQVNDSFFVQIENAHRREKEISTFMEWCDKSNINISSFCNIEYNREIENVGLVVEKLTQELRDHRVETKEGYTEFSENYTMFHTLYKDIFKENEQFVENISIEMITKKKQYIDHLFYHQNNSKKDQDVQNLEKHSHNLNKLDDKIGELNNIIDLYDSSIKMHWKKIMIDIEIPFHIYSGKIMQNYQRGLGLFIKEKSDTESIIFVSDNSSDHDALNYLSSGQLSALVISFTLALNKIYGHKDLGVLLIDDPVQTMDEINMASLTELLRNDFPHKQIVISTHEEDVSRYLQYKFNKYGLKSLSYNMRKESHV